MDDLYPMVKILVDHGYSCGKDDSPFLAVKHDTGITTLVHWDADYLTNIDETVKNFFIQKNNLYENFICLYSPIPHQLLLNNLSNFPFRYKFFPELLFLEVQRFIDFDKLKKLPPPKFQRLFCFLNKRPTAYRKELFTFFRDNNLLDQSYASYLNSSQRGGATDEIEKPFKNFEENLKDPDIGQSNVNFYPVTDFLFDVCAETYIEDYIGLTEKSIKPFLWGHVPLIYGPTGTYEYLKNLGFDVFGDIVNLGFDNEQDNNIRMWRFQQEILRLSKIPIEKYSTVLLESRFVNNRVVYLKNVRRSLKILDWIKQETAFMVEHRKQYLGGC